MRSSASHRVNADERERALAEDDWIVTRRVAHKRQSGRSEGLRSLRVRTVRHAARHRLSVEGPRGASRTRVELRYSDGWDRRHRLRRLRYPGIPVSARHDPARRPKHAHVSATLKPQGSSVTVSRVKCLSASQVQPPSVPAGGGSDGRTVRRRHITWAWNGLGTGKAVTCGECVCPVQAEC